MKALLLTRTTRPCLPVVGMSAFTQKQIFDWKQAPAS
jgi:hypothetical protein